MKTYKINNKIKVTAFLTLPLALAFYSQYSFTNWSNKITNNFANMDGAVAGASDSKVTNITEDIPIIKDAEIVNVDSTNEMVSVTLESDRSEKEINDFYKNYINPNDSKMTVNISGQIIKITLLK